MTTNNQMKPYRQFYATSLSYTKWLFYLLLLLFALTALLQGVDFAAPIFVICLFAAAYNGLRYVYIVGFLRCNHCKQRMGKAFSSSNLNNWATMKRDITNRRKCPHSEHAIFK